MTNPDVLAPGSAPRLSILRAKTRFLSGVWRLASGVSAPTEPTTHHAPRTTF